MTLTQTKRRAFPVRYIRKDARTAIYRVLFGRQDHNHSSRNRNPRSNIPSIDDERGIILEIWDYPTARAVMDNNIGAAQFDPAVAAALWARLEAVKGHAKRKQQSA